MEIQSSSFSQGDQETESCKIEAGHSSNQERVENEKRMEIEIELKFTVIWVSTSMEWEETKESQGDRTKSSISITYDGSSGWEEDEAFSTVASKAGQTDEELTVEIQKAREEGKTASPREETYNFFAVEQKDSEGPEEANPSQESERTKQINDGLI